MHVLVTGASGYIAGFCIAELRAHGHTVRGTVRDPRKAEHLGDIELVAADLSRDEGWAEAVAGVDAVLHTASPFLVGTTDDEIVPPAVEGTLRVLRAAHAAGIRRVVVTSSTAAVVNTDAEVYDESCWSDPERCSPYPKSKTLAERAAWDFVAEHPELELVTCNPCLVIGPLQHGDRHSLSLEPLRRVLVRAMPAAPRLGFSVVDVRDVAAAHRLALEVPEAAGQRYVLFSDFLWLSDIGRIFREAFAAEGFRPPTRELPYPVVWLASRFDPGLRLLLPDIGKHQQLSSEKARRELGWQPRPARESLIDTGRSMIDHGVVSP